VLNLRFRCCNLGVEFRNLENCEYLALLDPVTYIDVDAPDISGHLSVKIDLLIRLKLTSHGQGTG
jgi:hypothetical protein